MRLFARFITSCLCTLISLLPFCAADATGSSWTPVPSVTLRTVAVAGPDLIYGITPDGDLVRVAGRVTAPLVPPKVAIDSLAAFGEELFALSADGQILRRSGDSWLDVSPPPGEVWMIDVDAAGRLLALGTAGLFRDDGAWTLVPAPRLAVFTAGRESDYWGITVDGDVVVRRENGDWVLVDAPALDLVSGGPDGTLFGIGGGHVFRYDGVSWTVVKGPAMRDVSVGSEAAVFALGPTGNADNLFEYVGD